LINKTIILTSIIATTMLIGSGMMNSEAYAATTILDVPTGDSCTAIGILNDIANTCTLTGDVSGSIEITGDGITRTGSP
jgi:hypothetical protein